MSLAKFRTIIQPTFYLQYWFLVRFESFMEPIQTIYGGHQYNKPGCVCSSKELNSSYGTMLAFSDVEDLIRRQRNRLDLSKKKTRGKNRATIYINLHYQAFNFPYSIKG